MGCLIHFFYFYFILWLVNILKLFICWGCPSGRFNSVALSFVFYTGFKTMDRNEFSSTVQPIFLELDLSYRSLSACFVCRFKTHYVKVHFVFVFSSGCKMLKYILLFYRDELVHTVCITYQANEYFNPNSCI